MGGTYNISEEDVIKLIMQFCKDKGFHASVESLHRESGVSASFEDEDQAGRIGDMISRGDWVQVLAALDSISLPASKLTMVYEQMLLELLEGGERTLAKELITSTKPLRNLEHSDKAHYDKLHALCYTNEHWNAAMAYDMGSSKERRRQEIRDSIELELVVVAPSRLLTLLGHSLQYLKSTGIVVAGSDTYDLFRGGTNTKNAGSQDVNDEITKAAVVQLPYDAQNKVESVAFHPDGVYIAMGGADGFIELRDCEDGCVVEHLPYQAKDQFMRHEKGVMCLVFGGKEGSAGDMLASGCQGGCIKVWKTATGVCLQKFSTAHNGAVTSVAFNKGGSQVLSTSLDGTIKCLGIRSGNPLREYRVSSSAGILNACYSLDYSRVFCVTADGFLRCWESTTAKLVYEVVPGADVTSKEISKCEASMIESQLAAIVRVQAMPEGNLFVCLRGRSAYLVNAKDGSTLTRYSSGKASAQKGDFLCGTTSAQGRYVYAAAEDGCLYVFDTRTGSLLSTMQCASCGVDAKGAGMERAREMLGVEHHPSRNLLVTFSSAGKLTIWQS